MSDPSSPPSLELLANAVDTAWTIACATFVVMMQLGFAMLEVGSVNAKNINNIILKGTLDICIAAIAFWAIGYSIAFGGGGKAALAGGFMAPPVSINQPVDESYAQAMIRRTPELTEEDFRRQPRMRLWEFQRDELSLWHHQLGRWFEIGTLYTMIAGMLNMLVIYDAGFGPLGTTSDEERRSKASEENAGSADKAAKAST